MLSKVFATATWIKRVGLILLSVVIMTLLLIVPQLVQAESHTASPTAQWIVNTAVDESDGSCSDGDCSLRDALAVAVNDDNITFAGDYTIYLNSTLTVTKRLTIDGSGHTIKVSGDTGGDGGPDVQVFYNSSTLTLTHLNIVSGTNRYGAGIYNDAILTIKDSTLSGNLASNLGGGIYNHGGTVTVQNSILSDNVAGYGGGGIYNFSGSTLTVKNCTFSTNWAWNFGGGIFNEGYLWLENSTLFSNTASYGYGGSLSSYGSTASTTILNSTLSENSAYYLGGGLYYWGGSQLQYWNTIIAHSSSGGDCVNAGTIITNVNNLVEDGSCSTNGVNFLSGDPGLGSLADNGGGTLTQALLPGSPAIESGDDVACPSTDQRGVARPQMTHCDIGAYEASPQIVIRLTKSVTPTVNIPANSVITYTLALRNIGGVVDPQGQLTDTLPYGVVFKQWVTQPGGAIINDNTITWTGALASYTSLTLTFQATRTAEAWGNPIVNTAYFSSTTRTATASAAFDPACSPLFTVQNANDSGRGSLRTAIDAVCSGGRIAFNGNTNITLSSTLLITRPVTIDGGGHTITLDGNHAVQVLSIGSNGTVTLSNLNIINGRAGSGGGIYNGGTLLLQNSTVSGNKADGYGGGIASYGALRVENSTLSGNSAYDSGGGLYTSGVSATLVLLNSTLSGNWITGNNSLGRGGGLNVGSGAQLQYWNTIIAHSSSGSDCVTAGTIITNVNNLVEDGSCSTNGVDFLEHSHMRSCPARRPSKVAMMPHAQPPISAAWRDRK